jgi:hypothetical protein
VRRRRDASLDGRLVVVFLCQNLKPPFLLALDGNRRDQDATRTAGARLRSFTGAFGRRIAMGTLLCMSATQIPSPLYFQHFN